MKADELRAKHDELSERLKRLRTDLAANEVRRTTLAFDAETGDATAKRKIGELANAAATLDIAIKTAEAAIAEAERRLGAAEEASRRQTEREKAKQARAIAGALSQRFAAIDAGLRQMADNLGEIRGEFRSMGALGAPVPNGALVAVNVRAAIYAALGGLGLDLPPIAPGARRSFEELGAGWLVQIERWASQILDAQGDKAA